MAIILDRMMYAAENFLITFLLTFMGMTIHSFRCSFSSERTSLFRIRYSLSKTIDEPTPSPGKLSFDVDFAEMMSKPLPEWYKEQKIHEEKVLKEMEARREEIIQEFKAKYDISEKEKIAIAKLKQTERDARAKAQKDQTWLLKVLGLVSEQDDGSADEDATEGGDNRSTREKWEVFWDEEQRDTGFYLPGFFEVFPELKLKWPIWARKKDGGAIKCETDRDCQFPQACCAHPIVPGDKFCCTGYGRRIMVPAYDVQRIQSSPRE